MTLSPSDTMIWFFWGLLAYHCGCAFSWRKERTELLNKLMSRDYHSYQFAKNIEKTMDSEPSLKEGIQAEERLAEDLSPIQSFGMN